MTEADVSRAIRRYLDAVGMTSWSTEQGYRAAPGGTRTSAGVPDLIVAGKGITGMIEVKSPKGRMRASQKRFRDVWIENGGEHVVARSARDVAEWLRGMGLDVPVPR